MKKTEAKVGVRIFIKDTLPLDNSRPNDVNQLNGVIIGEPVSDNPDNPHAPVRPLVRLDNGIVKRVGLHKLEKKQPAVPWKKSTTD